MVNQKHQKHKEHTMNQNPVAVETGWRISTGQFARSTTVGTGARHAVLSAPAVRAWVPDLGVLGSHA